MLLYSAFKWLFTPAAPPIEPSPPVTEQSPAQVYYGIRPNSDYLEIAKATKQGQKTWAKAVSAASTWTKAAATVGNAKVIMDTVHNRSISDGWYRFLTFPIDGTGIPAPPIPNVPDEQQKAMFGFLTTLHLLKDLSQVREEYVAAYTNWYHGDLARPMAVPTGELVQQPLPLNSPDYYERLCAEYKLRLRVVSQVIYDFLENHLTESSMVAMRVQKSKFQFTCSESGEVFNDGFYVLYLLLKHVKPTMVVSVEALRKKLESITLPGNGYNVLKATTLAQDLRLQIINEYGAPSCADNYWLTHYFRAMETANNKDFLGAVSRSKSDWEMEKPGCMDREVIVQHLCKLYNNKVHDKTWGKTESQSKEVVLVSEQLSEVRKQVKEQKKLLDEMKTAGTSKPSPASEGGEKKFGSWRTTFVGETSTNPENGKPVKWCKHHGKKGCYMPHDHDHAAWAADRAEKQKKRSRNEEDNEAPAGKKSKVTPKKLTLDPRIKQALVSNCIMSANEIGVMMDEVNAESKE